MKLVIRHGRLVDPASDHDAVADLYIADGRIAAVGAAPAGFSAEREIDARGLVVAPGLVDLCARMREPGAEGALKREMRSALAGGVTGVVCPPDTDPPLDEPGLVRMLKRCGIGKMKFHFDRLEEELLRYSTNIRLPDDLTLVRMRRRG